MNTEKARVLKVGYHNAGFIIIAVADKVLPPIQADARQIVLGLRVNPASLAYDESVQYATWEAYNGSCYSGHYSNDFMTAVSDFQKRIKNL